ncbi:hypothetical protein L6452_31145 [Arctium lappa]|uniref:Uncharacterized protein n=1 Tax=Arctium lappa TaxID=4217 RepID=A0ACB8ZPH6_ARCLA|nr:hypothetical protein L6452_31145 [Arctium lappa]
MSLVFFKIISAFITLKRSTIREPSFHRQPHLPPQSGDHHVALSLSISLLRSLKQSTSVAHLLHRLIKRMNVLNPYVRQFLVGWNTMLDSVPDIDMLGFLPYFLDVLLLKSANYGRMAKILVQQASSPDEFTRWTAITWVRICRLVHMHHSLRDYGHKALKGYLGARSEWHNDQNGDIKCCYAMEVSGPYRSSKSVEHERLAVYLDSDISPWCIAKPWEDLQLFEWDQFWHKGWKTSQCSCSDAHLHSATVTGSANYSKQRSSSPDRDQPLMKAVVSLDDVTICLSKSGYRDLMKLADNFSASNQRLKYAYFRPFVSVKYDLRSWWKYAYRVVSDKKARY